MFNNIFLLAILLIGVAFGADDKKCTLSEGRFKCLQKFHEIKDKSISLDLAKDEDVDKVNNVCEEYKKCAQAMKCQAEEDIIQIIDKMLTFCDIIYFRHTSLFEKCADTLDKEKTTCMKEWNPFPTKVADPKKMEEIQKEACKNFFGKDKCVEKEVTEKCGLETWKQFEKNYLGLNKMSGACHFD